MNDEYNDEINDLMKIFGSAKKTPSSNDVSGELTPAWGGTRKQGVPVPVEFDNVTSLGPATAVYGNNDNIGIFFNSAGLSFGPKTSKALVLYRDGFAYKSGNEIIQVWRWDEVSIITSNVDFQNTRRAYHSYTLTKKSGESLVLDETIQNAEDLIRSVKNNVFALLLPPLTSSYKSGKAITFGSITIHHQNGLQMGGKTYRWDDIMDIKVERGRFKITLRDSKRHEERASSVPNIEMLCRMIGLKLNQADLIYY
ncbi:MAG: DUF6585 family protein [Anaerolineales bacterium]